MEIQEEEEVIKRYINLNGGEWVSVNHGHPATFDMLAMNTEEKETLKHDLATFVGRKE